MNSEEQFEVRHYLSKTLQLFTKSTGSASQWFFSTIYLSLVGLFPTVGHTKKAVIPTPGIFIKRKNAVSFKNLCKNIENLTYIASTKRRNTHTLKKKTNNRRYCFTWPEILHIHTHTHTRKQYNEKFVLFAHVHYTPTLTIPPALGPEALDFSRRLPRGQMVADKKEQGF